MDAIPDRRREERTNANQPVEVTILGNPELCFSGTLADWSGSGACLEVDRNIPVGDLLKIETGDTLLLGEVVYSRPIGEGFRIGVALEHALYHTRDLAALSRKLLGDVEVKVKQ